MKNTSKFPFPTWQKQEKAREQFDRINDKLQK
jgi:hypothetical protein